MSILKKISLEDEMLQYLQKKYGKKEPFKILGTDCQSMFSKSHESKAISERFPEDVITIIKYKSHGKTHIEDNFIEICRRDEISQAYADLIKGIYPKYNVKVHALNPVVVVLPEDISMNTPADEIVHRKEFLTAMINIYVEDNVNKKEDRLIAMKNLIQKTIGELSIFVDYCTDINDSSTVYLSGYVCFDDQFDLSTIRWKTY
jgi:hypothetical protein